MSSDQLTAEQIEIVIQGKTDASISDELVLRELDDPNSGLNRRLGRLFRGNDRPFDIDWTDFEPREAPAESTSEFAWQLGLMRGLVETQSAHDEIRRFVAKALEESHRLAAPSDNSPNLWEVLLNAAARDFSTLQASGENATQGDSETSTDGRTSHGWAFQPTVESANFALTFVIRSLHHLKQTEPPLLGDIAQLRLSGLSVGKIAQQIRQPEEAVAIGLRWIAELWSSQQQNSVSQVG